MKVARWPGLASPRQLGPKGVGPRGGWPPWREGDWVHTIALGEVLAPPPLWRREYGGRPWQGHWCVPEWHGVSVTLYAHVHAVSPRSWPGPTGGFGRRV